MVNGVVLSLVSFWTDVLYGMSCGRLVYKGGGG